MDITGHGKGLSYDLGSEKEIGIFFGCIELLLWIFLCVPPLVHTLFRCKQKGIIPFLLVIFLFAALFALCIFVIYGGWNAFWEECSEII